MKSRIPRRFLTLCAGAFLTSFAVPVSPQTPRTAFGWRQLADACVSHGAFAKAADAFHEAAVRYRAMGDPGAYRVLEDYSERYRTDIALYYERPSDADT